VAAVGFYCEPTESGMTQTETLRRWWLRRSHSDHMRRRPSMASAPAWSGRSPWRRACWERGWYRLDST